MLYNLKTFLFVGAKNEGKVTVWQEENYGSNHSSEDIHNDVNKIAQVMINNLHEFVFLHFLLHFSGLPPR